MATASTQPVQGPFTGFNPGNFFGQTGAKFGMGPGGPFDRPEGGGREGAGLYGLPEAFSGWNAPARYAFAPALQFSENAQEATDYFKGEMGKDYGKELFGLSSDVAEAQFSDARRRGEQGLARAGYGGGGTVSPFAGLQVQAEGAARAGVMGNAARQSVLQAQQMKSEAGRNYLNSLAQQFQALLTPAQLQVSQQAKVPVSGSAGPGIIGPALGALSSFIGAAA